MASRTDDHSLESPGHARAHLADSLWQDRRDQESVVKVPIRLLLESDSPRLDGVNTDHARALAESETELPPIIVNRSTMRVVDGMHRLRAAALRGHDEIEVRFFDGDENETFVLAVQANIMHGLPLSLADRTAATARILRSHPQWSDRAIASVTGVSARTVGAMRRRSSMVDHNTSTRIGRDGRVRPLSATEGRKIATELMKEKPDAPLREIASKAGISLGTAHDARKRLRLGENPVLSQQQERRRRKKRLERRNSPSGHDDQITGCTSVGDRAEILQNLKRDPSLRFAEAGRVLIRMLHALTFNTKEWERLIDTVPAHCAVNVSAAARACAQAWQEFAEQLERR